MTQVLEVAEFVKVQVLGQGYDGVSIFNDKKVRSVSEHNKEVEKLSKVRVKEPVLL